MLKEEKRVTLGSNFRLNGNRAGGVELGFECRSLSVDYHVINLEFPEPGPARPTGRVDRLTEKPAVSSAGSQREMNGDRGRERSDRQAEEALVKVLMPFELLVAKPQTTTCSFYLTECEWIAKASENEEDSGKALTSHISFLYSIPHSVAIWWDRAPLWLSFTLRLHLTFSLSGFLWQGCKICYYHHFISMF